MVNHPPCRRPSSPVGSCATPSSDAFVGRQVGLFHLVCYRRDGNQAFETYWTTRRGAEVLDYSYALMDLTIYGRQEPGRLATRLAAAVFLHSHRRRRSTGHQYQSGRPAARSRSDPGSKPATPTTSTARRGGAATATAEA